MRRSARLAGKARAAPRRERRARRTAVTPQTRRRRASPVAQAREDDGAGASAGHSLTFEDIDTNKDGVISHREFDAAFNDAGLVAQTAAEAMMAHDAALNGEPTDAVAAQTAAHHERGSIFNAIMKGDAERVFYLLEEKPSLLGLRGPVGELPVHMAAIFRHNELLRAILARFPEQATTQFEGSECVARGRERHLCVSRIRALRRPSWHAGHESRGRVRSARVGAQRE